MDEKSKMSLVEKRSKESSETSTDILSFQTKGTNEKFEDPNLERDGESISSQAYRVLSEEKSLDHINKLIKTMSHRSVGKDFDTTIDPDDFDLTRTLRAITKRFDQEGLPLAYTGVTFKQLTSMGVDFGSSYWPTVTEMGRELVKIPYKIFSTQPRKERAIVKNAYGVVKPGEMLLVLGRPGAGCTSLLKTLSAETDQFLSVEGEILYDGVNIEQMNNHFRKEIIYNPECEY